MTESTPTQTILGFDFGTKRIGVASSQSLTKTATPLATLMAKEGLPNWDEVKKLIDEWQPEILVVGRPIHMDGTESEITIRAHKFAKRLHGRFGKPVVEIDERRTTDQARSIIRHHRKGGSAHKVRDNIDAASACLICERYWESY